MGEALDFASTLMKLVLILLVVMMAGTLVIAPGRALVDAPVFLMLLAPLFILAMVLDLVEFGQRFFAHRLTGKPPHHYRHD
ncbi:MAG: hypothetical protein QM805_23660 [Pseudomonas sp.]